MEDIQFLDDWESKYRYIISLGDQMSIFPEKYKTESYQVKGCMSQVWLYHESQNNIYTFYGDSDAKIVRGLIALLLIIINNQTKEQIKKNNFHAIFHQLSLDSHLSINRRNGFFSMVSKIGELIY